MTGVRLAPASGEPGISPQGFKDSPRLNPTPDGVEMSTQRQEEGVRLKIAYGANRYAKRWTNKWISYNELLDRFRVVLRTPETVEEYARLRKGERDQIKDVGGFVLGHLRGGARRKGAVECRSAIALDADRAPQDFREVFATRIRHRCALYTTHSHTPEAPRLRLIFPLSREINAEEYVAVGRLLADEIGIDYFDDSTYEPERLMYWPSAPSNGEYVFETYDAYSEADPDEILGRVSDWRDWSLLPTSSRQSELIRRELSKAEDPLLKRGVVGAFCRSYPIQEAVGAFLSEVYAPVRSGEERGAPKRYDYLPADSSAGVVVYEDKWVYSHHATDPASGRLLNAYDLVRVHRFGDLDDRASRAAMNDFALNDERVRLQLADERLAQARAEFAPGGDGWEVRLERARDGTLKNTLHNLELILENDEGLVGIVKNELADELEALDGLPWDDPARLTGLRRFWRDADDAQLVSYVDARYGSFSERNFNIAVTKVTDDRRYHPIRQYLNALPPWDGTERVERLLIDYLGAEDSPYTRAATRKTLCAAVARVLAPGTKFDHILVLCGAQGVGKSTLIARLGGEWFTDSLSLTDMEDKTGAEKLQGKWLIEIGELAGMRKADIDRVKSFISRQDDRFRASFGRRASSHPRQCVFFGTTNSEDGFLRDPTGNRRFWVVDVSAESLMKSWQLDEETTKQIWAEAFTYVRNGESLFFPREIEAEARIRQVQALEADEREGLVQAYLDVLLPENWEEMDIYARQAYCRFRDDPTNAEGVFRRSVVSNIEIWVECFGKKAEDLKPQDSYQISRIMNRIEGWRKSRERMYLSVYGRQRVYERIAEPVETVGAFGKAVRWRH